MATRFLPLILCIIFMYSGCKLFKINDGTATLERKEEKKDLCENGVETMAMLQNEYTEQEIAGSKTYSYKYDYTVDEVSYTGSFSDKVELENPIVAITYSPKFPDKSTTKDPCVVYESIKDATEPYPQWFEYIGIGLFLLGAMFVKSSGIRAFTGGQQA